MQQSVDVHNQLTLQTGATNYQTTRSVKRLGYNSTNRRTTGPQAPYIDSFSIFWDGLETYVMSMLHCYNLLNSMSQIK